MLFDTLGANLLGNILTCKGVKVKIHGREDNGSGEEVIRAGKGIIAISWGQKSSENLAAWANIPGLGRITASQNF